jgi:hypothetical protein
MGRREKATPRGGFVVGTGEFLVVLCLIGGYWTTSAPHHGGEGLRPSTIQALLHLVSITDNWVTSDNFALSIAIIDHASCVDMLDKHAEDVLRNQRRPLL